MNWLYIGFTVFLVTTITHLNEVNAKNEDRIIGGKDAPYGTFMFLPFLILHYPEIHEKFPVNMFNYETCSSTIISKRHILTAAHCLLGAEKINKKREHRKIQKHVNYIVDYRPEKEKAPFKLNKHAMSSRAYIHPSYDPITFKYDLAIIEFPETAQIEFAPIQLINNYEPKDGDFAVAAGYGLISPGKYPDKLQNATVPIFEKETCKIRKSHHICTGEEKLRAHQGDSGGPLMINQNETFYQIGIASHTADVNGVGRTFYIPLSKHCDWIEKVTKKKVKCRALPKSTPPGPPPPAELSTTPEADEPHDDHGNGKEFIKFNAFTLIFSFFIAALMCFQFRCCMKYKNFILK